MTESTAGLSAHSGTGSAVSGACPDQVRESAVAAARRFLADTVETIIPDTPAAELLACAARSRQHLAALVADQQQPGPGSGG